MATGRVETATVVFTDLVASTELRSRVGEDAADALRAVHDALVTEAITSNGGVVVKYLGDGAMATFSAATTAVDAAVAVQQAIDEHNRRGGEAMSVRVGIAAGDVTFADGDCHGLPVIAARRLESVAKPDTILCSELVMHLAKGRTGQVFNPLGELDLKGLREPVSACEVLWERVAATSFEDRDDLPPILARAGGLPFSGREDMVGELREAWNRCVAGGFEGVLLAGEPGIGKTRLARQLAKVAYDDGHLVLAGRCEEAVRVPFHALGTALSWFVDHHTGDVRGDLGRFPGDLVRLVPHLTSAVGDLPPPLDSEPEAERYRLMEAVTSWLSSGGVERPRLFVIDDLHWADQPTLLLLRHVIEAAPPGLMVICTYRDTDVDRAHPLASMLADLRRLPNVTRVSVGGLDLGDVEKLIGRTGGHELDEIGRRFAQTMHSETAGNPFFVTEVLRHLVETGALVERGGRWTSDLLPEEAGIPEGIREVVGRRLGQLGDAADMALRAASVIGNEFDVALVAKVMRRDEDVVVDALDAAVAASLAQEIGVDRYRFSHALVRETLHGELSSTRRARQHRRVAEALEERHGDDLGEVINELAVHWSEASAGGDPARAIECCLEAGDQAIGVGAPETAARWFSQVLELADDDDAFAAVVRQALIRRGRAKIRFGSTDVQQDLNRAARSALDDEDVGLAAEALVVTSRISFDESQHPEVDKIDLLREALAVIGELAEDSPAPELIRRAELLGELATELIFIRDIEGRRNALAEMNRLIEPLAPEQRGRLLTNHGRHTHSAGIETWRALVSDVRAHVEVCSSSAERVSGLAAMWFGQIASGSRTEADRTVEEITAIISTLHDRFVETWSLLFLQFEHILAGRVDDMEKTSRTLFDEWRRLAMPEAVTYFAVGTYMAERERGRLDRVIPAWSDSADGLHPASATHAGLALALAASGDVDGASRLLDDIGTADIAEDAGFAPALGMWAETCVLCGSEDQCRDFLETLDPLDGVHLIAGGIYLGAVTRIRGLLLDRLGRSDEADIAFRSAVRQHTDMRAAAFLVRTHLDWADSLLRRDDRPGAQIQVDAATVLLAGTDLADSTRRHDQLVARLP